MNCVKIWRKKKIEKESASISSSHESKKCTTCKICKPIKIWTKLSSCFFYNDIHNLFRSKWHIIPTFSRFFCCINNACSMHKNRNVMHIYTPQGEKLTTVSFLIFVFLFKPNECASFLRSSSSFRKIIHTKMDFLFVQETVWGGWNDR